MPRQRGKVEITKFIKGLNTDASPLDFPANFSLDEKNFILNKNGLRTRRLGFDLEDGYIEVITDVQIGPSDDLATGFYKWDNAGGDSTDTIVVVQVGKQVLFFDATSVPLSSGLISKYTYSTLGNDKKISFSSVDGMLVAATGNKPIDIYVYDGTTITKFEQTLMIRDLFGVADFATTT